ncbi:MAG: vanadium-dependent haloperoxidase, partial [Chitinophagaceae bacterium]|nr:vanadium-dependent haloperoxidase [Chitinophagaceae bacterium]
ISIDSLENAYNNRLKLTVSSSVFERSQTFGRKIALAVFEWSKSDKFDVAGAAYTPPVFPGAWQPTPPAFANAATPYLPNCRPNLESHATGFGKAFPFEYSEAPTSAFYKMVREVYDVSKSLTTDQRNIGFYWNDVGVGRGYTPPGHEISVVNQLITQEKISLGLASQAYAKAGMAQWDSQIMCWRAKYKNNLMRPVTYIQKVIEPGWLPLIPTPPHPEYPAAHAYITAATMAAVGSVLGDKHNFTDHTYDFLGFPARSFTSLTDIGKEAGISRLYGGIHYTISINTGLEAGQNVGREIGKINFTK